MKILSPIRGRQWLLPALLTCGHLAAHAQNVGIGTTTPQAPLHVIGLGRYTVQGGAALQLDGGATGQHVYLEYYPEGVANGRQAFLGYPSDGSHQFVLNNSYADGDLLFNTANTARFILKASGLVGIGTSSPTALLDVNGTTRLRGLPTAGIVTTDASGNLSSATAASLALTTASNGLTRNGTDIQLGGSLTQNTTVAIGTNRFDLTGTITNSPAVDQTNLASVISNFGGNVLMYQSFQPGSSGTLTQVVLRLAMGLSNSTELPRLTVRTGTGTGGTTLGSATLAAPVGSTGNYTFVFPTTPTILLTAGQPYSLILENGTSDLSSALSIWYANTNNSYPNGQSDFGGSNDYLFETTMQTMVTQSLLSAVGGKVGIGTNSPAAGLFVNQPEAGSSVLNTQGVAIGGGTDGNPSLELRGSNQTPYIDFAETSSADYTTRLLSSGGVLNVYSSGSGNIFRVNGAMQATAFNITSDARFKTAVRPLNGALASVLALRGVRYRWNALGVQRGGQRGAEQVGLLAQELEKVYPELVATDAQGYKSVNYAQLAPVLIEALKEQQAQLEALKANQATDHADLQTLKEQLAKLQETGSSTGQAQR